MPASRTWTTIRWNGLSLACPERWHPAVIRRDYLLFEDGYQPVMDVKWRRQSTMLPAKRLLARLRRQLPGTTFSACPQTPSWQQAAADYHCHGFGWQDRDGGAGVAIHLFCPQCHTASLLRFHGPVGNAAAPAVLAAFHDHLPSAPDLLPWRILDLSFATPPAARLLTHEFLVGKYRLVFQLPDQRLTIHRFKPAGQLLAGTDLVSFSAALADNLEIATHNSKVVERCLELRGARWFAAKLRRQPTHVRFRLWHDAVQNGLLAIHLTGRDELDPDLFARICDACRLL